MFNTFAMFQASNTSMNVPYGFCHCGCGQKTNIVKESSRSLGRVKGEPYRFLVGHRPCKETTEQRFWRQVRKGDAPDSCWEWTGAVRDRKLGYGTMYVHEDKKSRFAHRVSWTLAHGKIPEGMGVLHKCDNPKWVRPDHLFLGTQADNMYDMWRKKRGPRGTRRANAELDEEIVKEIRMLFRRGASNIDIARIYDVSSCTISDVRLGKTWGWLT